MGANNLEIRNFRSKKHPQVMIIQMGFFMNRGSLRNDRKLTANIINYFRFFFRNRSEKL